MIHKVFLFSTSSRYDLVRAFLEGMREGFQEGGWSVSFLSPESDFSVLQEEEGYLLSINGSATDLKESASCTQLFPLSIFIDDPLSQGMAERLARKGRGWVTLPDPELIEVVLDSHPAPPHRVTALAHGALIPASSSERERTLSLLFPASFIDPNSLFSRLQAASFPETLPFLEWVQDKGGRSLWALWKEWNLEHPLLPFHQRVAEATFLPLVELYLRHLRRAHLVRSCAAAGLSLTLVGEGWEAHPDLGSHQWLGSQPWDRVGELFHSASLVLHTHPPFFSGAHERPLSAMAHGAVAVVEENPYWTEEFEEGEELLSYRLHEVESLPHRLKELLSRPEEIKRMGERGRERVNQGHRWKDRALEIIRESEDASFLAHFS